MSIVVEEKREELITEKVKNPPPRYLGFIAGTCSGVMKNVVGHPFDTVKVRLQTADPGRFKGPMDCVMQTFKKEGFRGFYKGFTPPLVGWVLMDSVMLGSLHVYKRFLMENVYDNQELPLSGVCLAGLGAGLTVSFVAAPIEQFKARLQVQYDAKTKLYNGPLDVVKKLYQTSGIRGIYSGLFSTMIFRTNFVFWWGSYEIFNKWFAQNTNMSKAASNFWSGGLSATVFWIFAYPADVVKQTIMTDSPIRSEKKFPRWIDAVKYIYRVKGLGGFTKGFGPSILRSFPANAAALAAFEAAMRFMH